MYAFATHGLLNGPAAGRIAASVLEEVVVFVNIVHSSRQHVPPPTEHLLTAARSTHRRCDTIALSEEKKAGSGSRIKQASGDVADDATDDVADDASLTHEEASRGVACTRSADHRSRLCSPRRSITLTLTLTLSQITLAPLLAEAIRRTHKKESLSALFTQR